MSEQQLAEEIIALSNANFWDTAKLEWELADIYEAEEPGTCTCGHFPIIETCILINRINSNRAVVGNCCVKKFIGLPSDIIFQVIQRVRKDNEKSLNKETIDHAYRRRWDQRLGARILYGCHAQTEVKQQTASEKNQINEKIIQNMKRRS